MARAYVLLAAVLFGTTGTAQALGPEIEPLAVGAARIAVGAALLALVAALAGRLGRLRGNTRLVLLAGACVALYQASFFASVDATGVAVGTVVAIGFGTVLVGVLGHFLAGERLGGRWLAATALAGAGVCLLVLGDDAGAGDAVSLPGIGLALLAGGGYAVYTVAAKRILTAGATPEGVMAAVFGVGAILLLPVLFVVPAGGLLSADGLVLAAYLGALPTALAYILFARGLERIGAGDTATLTLAEPVTAAALGAIVLAERPGTLAVLGGLLVLGGLALIALRPARPPVLTPQPA